jgi:xanthine dehydrogenase accessory factor
MQNSDLEVLQSAIEWLESGFDVELVTLVKCWGSAPRPVGSLAVVRSDGVIVGSVSGGCIEKELSRLLRKKDSTNLICHEVSDEQAIQFGLPCGGSLELVFENLNDPNQLREMIGLIEDKKRVCRVVNLDTGHVEIELANQDQEFSFDGLSVRRVFGSSWSLLLTGAGQLSRFVAQIGLALDYEILVCEPRELFAKAWNPSDGVLDSRWPDEVIASVKPDGKWAVLALSHDANLDDLAVVDGLSSDAFYVGSLGSRKTSNARRKRLSNVFGIDDARLAKLHGPIGLPIGSQTPAEIAVSILAEITAVRNGIKLVSK